MNVLILKRENLKPESSAKPLEEVNHLDFEIPHAPAIVANKIFFVDGDRVKVLKSLSGDMHEVIGAGEVLNSLITGLFFGVQFKSVKKNSDFLLISEWIGRISDRMDWRPIPKEAQILSIGEWEFGVANEVLRENNGHGFFVRGDQMSHVNCWDIEWQEAYGKFTHVAWFKSED